MTHDEAVTLLPVYALGALDDDGTALETHIRHCSRCTALLASYLESTVALGHAVAQVTPPPSLRAAVLASVPPARIRRAPRLPWAMGGVAGRVAAVLLVLSVGLTGGVVAQSVQLRGAHEELALDTQGLALLTSTETTVERLAPVSSAEGQAHGHWYHHRGVPTQVLVIEFMLPTGSSEGYYGWLRHADGTVRAAGRFVVDSSGYGRIILPGDDGSDVRSVDITRQTRASASPEGQLVLRWPSS